MRYTEKPPAVEAHEFTKELATAADRRNDSKLPAPQRKAFADFDEFFSDPDVNVDGTWLSVVNPDEDAEWGKYGVYCQRAGQWKSLIVGSWAVQYESDGSFDVLSAEDFEGRFQKSPVRAVPAAKKEGE